MPDPSNIITPAEILDFWFAGDPPAWREVWFKRDDVFDAACMRFGPALHAARQGLIDHWMAIPDGALALVVLLDQFSRNLHRNSPQAFAADAKARAVARHVLARGFDRMVGPLQRIFLYLPFEHSEDLADQDRSVRLFQALQPELGGDTVGHAERHREIIRRFGRFPHRNAALGRTSTPEEEAYLAEPGAGF